MQKTERMRKRNDKLVHLTKSTLTTIGMSSLIGVTVTNETLKVALHFVRHKSNSSQPSKCLICIPQKYFKFAKNIWRIYCLLGW